MSQRRLERVAALLKREVAEFIERRVKNPGFGFVTVTGIKVSNDLKHAKVLVVCRGDADQKEISLKILKGCVPSLRRDLNSVLRMRHVPWITFVSDKSYDDADRIIDLLGELNDEENS